MVPRTHLASMLALALAVSACVTAGPHTDPATASEGVSEIPSPAPTKSASPSTPPEPTSSAAESSARSLLPDEIPLPTAEPGAGGSDALLPDVRLAGNPDLNGGCLWLEATEAAPGGGNADSRVSAIWPYGFRAYRDPLRLVGPDGQLVARVGDILSVGGGFPPVDYLISPEFDPCGTGEVFAVSEVVSVNGVTVRIGAP